jgi:CheY-like chemotaxis protein
MWKTAMITQVSFYEALRKGSMKSVWIGVDGEDALDYLFERGSYTNGHPDIDLIILDLRMPKCDGLEVLRQIKTTEKLKMLPVVILTTSDAELDRSKAYKYNANSYLVKPIDYDTIVHLSETLKLYWFTYNRSERAKPFS